MGPGLFSGVSYPLGSITITPSQIHFGSFPSSLDIKKENLVKIKKNLFVGGFYFHYKVGNKVNKIAFSPLTPGPTKEALTANGYSIDIN